MSDELRQRLERLEAIQAVQALKARYLAACDAKDVAGFRACFADGPVDIDYGPIGCFDSADDLTAVYQQIACHPHMLEWHHASNPQIEILGPDAARGRWSLHYQLINTQEKTLTQIGGEYRDRYVRGPQGWKMQATTFAPRTHLSIPLSESALAALLGAAPAEATS